MKRKSFLLLELSDRIYFLRIVFSQTDDAVVAGKEVAIVQTEAGKVRGYIHKGIFTYKGIPYAKAERFMAPGKPACMERCSQFNELWPGMPDGSHNYGER